VARGKVAKIANPGGHPPPPPGFVRKFPVFMGLGGVIRRKLLKTHILAFKILVLHG
jgi:hypothetical protein